MIVDRIRNLFPSGASTEKPLPRPVTTSTEPLADAQAQADVCDKRALLAVPD